MSVKEEKGIELVEAELRVQKLKHEIEALKLPWWKKIMFQATFVPLVAAIITLGQSWLQQKDTIKELPKETGRVIVGYASGVLASPSGQAALSKAINSTQPKEEIAKILQNVVAQSLDKYPDLTDK